MGSCVSWELKNQLNIFFIYSFSRGYIVIAVVVQIKICVHYHDGALARNISASYWKIGTWKSMSWNFTVAGKRKEGQRKGFKLEE